MEPDRTDFVAEPAAAVTERSGSAVLEEAGGAGRSPEGPAVDPAVLDHLLAMAHRYRDEGHLWQAMELYWRLAEEHQGTRQAGAARAVLLELAMGYERSGARHLARSMYERLL